MTLLFTCLALTVTFGGPAKTPAAPERPPEEDASPVTSSSEPTRDRPALRTTVIDDASEPGAAQQAADARNVGTVTVLETDRVTGATPADAAPELISRLPGASVRGLGGLGQFAAVSVRGSTAQQVQLVVDGVPLNDGFAGLFDLSMVPLESTGRIELYRGHVPLAFGGAAPGGVLQFVGRPIDTTRTRAAAGLGSFGARQISASHHQRLAPRWGISAQLGYAGAEGNFPYYDTANTPSVPDDDRLSRRSNNDYDRVSAQVRVQGRGTRWRWHLRQLWSDREQGIAGPATAPASEARLRTMQLRTLSGARIIGLGGPGGFARGVAGLHLQRRDFDDPRGEVGLGTGAQRTDSLDLYLAPHLRLPAWRGAFWELHGSARIERVHVRDVSGVGAVAEDRHRRQTGTVGAQVEQTLGNKRWRIDGAVQMTAVRSQFQAADTEADAPVQRLAFDVGWAPRAAVRWQPHPQVDVRSSVGWYFRPPTLIELFGDRGFALGNESLTPERGTSLDLTLTWRRNLGGRLRGYARLRGSGFLNLGRDTITWVQTAQVVRPLNLGETLVAGAEASAAVSLWRRALVLDANYTFLETRNRGGLDGQEDAPLPGRPRHQVAATTSTGWRFTTKTTSLEPRLAYKLDAIASTYLDPSGRLSLPPRILHGLALELHIARVCTVALEVRNLTNNIDTTWTPSAVAAAPQRVPVTDFIGYPIPGRSLWGTVLIAAW